MNYLNLFKYYSPKYDGDYNLSFHTQGEIYFQQPIKFNDPWDCKAPPITVNRQLNSLKYIWDKLGENNKHIFNDNEWNRLKNLGRSEIKQYFTKLFQDAFDKQRSKIGVFSLSFIPDSELMWSHYAKSHRGYMLHFQINLEEYINTTGIQDTGIPVPVIYRSDRESWNIADYYENREGHMYNLVRYKSNAWQYECELRILNTTKYGFIKIPNNCLKSVVIGIDTDKTLRNKLENIGNDLNIPIYSSEMSYDKFKIIIPGLNINGVDGENQYQSLVDSKLLDLNINK